MHGDTFVKQLGNGTEESKARMQSALNFAWPYALGIFEEGINEGELIKSGVFIGENAIKDKWLEKVSSVIEMADLKLPEINTAPINGGRKGYHSEHLLPLMDEMCEVVRSDENTAEW